MSHPNDPYAAWKALPESSRRPTSWLIPDPLLPPETVTPEDFTIEAGYEGAITLYCPHSACPWAREVEYGTLRWVLAAARDHLDDKEANHG